jgi:hypothetical protein
MQSSQIQGIPYSSPSIATLEALRNRRMEQALLAIAAIDPGADEFDTLMALSEAREIAEGALIPITAN